MSGAKVVFFTNLDPELRQVVVDKALPGMDVTAAPAAMDDDEKIELVRDADFIMLFPGKISDRVLQAAKKCKLLQLLSAGYDEMNLPLAEDLGIAVANNGGANRVAVAEHTMMLMIACHRRLMTYANDVKAGLWKQEQNRKIDVFELEGRPWESLGWATSANRWRKGPGPLTWNSSISINITRCLQPKRTLLACKPWRWKIF